MDVLVTRELRSIKFYFDVFETVTIFSSAEAVLTGFQILHRVKLASVGATFLNLFLRQHPVYFGGGSPAPFEIRLRLPKPSFNLVTETREMIKW